MSVPRNNANSGTGRRTRPKRAFEPTAVESAGFEGTPGAVARDLGVVVDDCRRVPETDADLLQVVDHFGSVCEIAFAQAAGRAVTDEGVQVSVRVSAVRLGILLVPVPGDPGRSGGEGGGSAEPFGLLQDEDIESLLGPDSCRCQPTGTGAQDEEVHLFVPGVGHRAVPFRVRGRDGRFARTEVQR